MCPPIWSKLKIEGLYLHAKVKEGALKIGSPNPIGWIAYQLDGVLFMKRADYIEGGAYLDEGASSQVYVNQEFIELETLGPVVELAGGESTNHGEVWEVFREGNWPKEISGYFEETWGSFSGLVPHLFQSRTKPFDQVGLLFRAELCFVAVGNPF